MHFLLEVNKIKKTANKAFNFLFIHKISDKGLIFSKFVFGTYLDYTKVLARVASQLRHLVCTFVTCPNQTHLAYRILVKKLLDKAFQ